MHICTGCIKPKRVIEDWQHFLHVENNVTTTTTEAVVVAKSWRGSCVNAHRRRAFDEVLQPRVAELQADDVVEFFSFWWRRFIIASPLGHGHLNSLLGCHVHDVDNAATTCKTITEGFSMTIIIKKKNTLKQTVTYQQTTWHHSHWNQGLASCKIESIHFIYFFLVQIHHHNMLTGIFCDLCWNNIVYFEKKTNLWLNSE